MKYFPRPLYCHKDKHGGGHSAGLCTSTYTCMILYVQITQMYKDVQI